MNIKVVVAWSFAIVLFLIFGIFGLVNQDLLVIDEPDEIYVPNDGEETSNCVSNVGTGDSVYRFKLNETTKQIEKVTIMYSSHNYYDPLYKDAFNLNSLNINGITSSLSNISEKFVLIINVDVNNLDIASVENHKDDYKKLSVVISNIKDYEQYKSLIKENLETEYKCN